MSVSKRSSPPEKTLPSVPSASPRFSAKLDDSARVAYLDMARKAESFLGRLVFIGPADSTEYRTLTLELRNYFENLGKTDPVTFHSSLTFRKRIAERILEKFGQSIILD